MRCEMVHQCCHSWCGYVQSCAELLDILKVGKFDSLKQHLDALVALYNIDGDKYVFVSRQKAYPLVTSIYFCG